VVKPDFRHQKVETCEQSYYQEEYQWIGKREEKTAYEVGLVACGRVGGFLQLVRRVLPENVKAEPYEHCTADQLDYVLVAFEEPFDERQPESGEKAIE
jgi:hypothetical protein